MSEARQSKVYIQGLAPKALQLLLDYIYTSEITISEENVQTLLPAASLLQLSEVREACCEFLKNQLHPSNCLGITAFADLHSCTALHHYAATFTEHHFGSTLPQVLSWSGGQLSEVREACCEFLKNQLHPSNCLGITAFADLHSCTALHHYAATFTEHHFGSTLPQVLSWSGGQLSEVREACCEFLKNQLHPSNCLGITAFADLHSCTALHHYAATFTEHHFGSTLPQVLSWSGGQLSEVREACCEFLKNQLHPSNCLGITAFADLHSCTALHHYAATFTEHHFGSTLLQVLSWSGGQLSEVREACCEFLKNQLHPSNCLGITAFADLHSCTALHHYAATFTEHHFGSTLPQVLSWSGGQLSEVREACCEFLKNQLHPSNCLGITAFADLHSCTALHHYAATFTEHHFGSTLPQVLSWSGGQLSEVREACCEFLKNQLHPSNCLGITAFADLHSCTALHHYAATFTEHHFGSTLPQVLSWSGGQLSEVREACCEFLKNQLHPSNCLGITAFADLHSCTALHHYAATFTEHHFGSTLPQVLSWSGGQLSEVREACCEFLKNQLHPSNCLGITAFADLHSCTALHHYAATFTEHHFGELVKSEEFVNLGGDEVSRLISSDRLTISGEDKVFEGVIQWVRHDPEGRKKDLPKLMEHVRLPLLSKDYLVDKVDKEPLLMGNTVCMNYIIEAMKFHLMKEEQQLEFRSPRARPRQPAGLPKVTPPNSQCDGEHGVHELHHRGDEVPLDERGAAAGVPFSQGQAQTTRRPSQGYSTQLPM